MDNWAETWYHPDEQPEVLEEAIAGAKWTPGSAGFDALLPPYPDIVFQWRNQTNHWGVMRGSAAT